jgi:predicted nucleotidyltransferase
MILKDKTLNILEQFSDDYNKRIYGRDLAKKLKMNQKTISNLLNKLEKLHVLKFSTEGKNKYYFLNVSYPHIKEIIKLIEISKRIKLTEKYKKFIDLFAKLELRVNGILLIFGSYAKFSADERSDLDLLIIGKSKEFGDLEKLYGIKINAVQIDKRNFNKNEILIKEVIKNHVILKGMEEFIELIW